MNPHKPGTKEYSKEENILEFKCCLDDYVSHNPNWTWEEIIRMAEGYKRIHEEIEKGE